MEPRLPRFYAFKNQALVEHYRGALTISNPWNGTLIDSLLIIQNVNINPPTGGENDTVKLKNFESLSVILIFDF